MTSDELTNVLVQLVNNAPPDQLVALIRAQTPLSEAQARQLADTILTTQSLKADVDTIASRGDMAVPPEIP